MRDEDMPIEKDMIEDLFAAKVVAKVVASSNDDSLDADAAEGPVSLDLPANIPATSLGLL